MLNKPLRKKCYGRICHLPGSQTSTRDRTCNIGDRRLAIEIFPNPFYRVIVSEKLDGSSVGVAKMGSGNCIPLVRSGYRAEETKYFQHKLFAKWVYDNFKRFNDLLRTGERACGEWMALAHGTRYKLHHEPFVIFDIMEGNNRICQDVLQERSSKYEFITPHIIHRGGPLPIKDALEKLGTYGFHGALDPVEGAVWRIERKKLVNPYENWGPREWRFEAIVKYVKPDKKFGCYFPERTGDKPIWNWYPSGG